MVASLVAPSTAPLRRRSTRLRWISLPWTATLTDGSTAVVRGAAEDDATALSAMIARCSPPALHNRFLVPVDTIPAGLLQDLLSTEVSFVARDPTGSTVALANLAAEDPRTAEIALLVEDAFAGRGLETAILAHCVASAHMLGYRAVTMRALSHTLWPLRVLARLGKVQVGEAAGGVRVARLTLTESVMSAARGSLSGL